MRRHPHSPTHPPASLEVLPISPHPPHRLNATQAYTQRVALPDLLSPRWTGIFSISCQQDPVSVDVCDNPGSTPVASSAPLLTQAGLLGQVRLVRHSARGEWCSTRAQRTPRLTTSCAVRVMQLWVRVHWDHFVCSVDDAAVGACALGLPPQACPEPSSGLFSRMTFSWMTPMMRAGFLAPLTPLDIWKLPPGDQVQTLQRTFTR